MTCEPGHYRALRPPGCKPVPPAVLRQLRQELPRAVRENAALLHDLEEALVDWRWSWAHQDIGPRLLRESRARLAATRRQLEVIKAAEAEAERDRHGDTPEGVRASLAAWRAATEQRIAFLETLQPGRHRPASWARVVLAAELDQHFRRHGLRVSRARTGAWAITFIALLAAVGAPVPVEIFRYLPKQVR